MLRLTKLLSLVALTGMLGGCARPPLSISQTPLRVETIYFENMPRSQPTYREKGYEAYTVWFFHCLINLDTEDVEREDTSGASSVRLKIKAIYFDLSCPIKMYISKKAPPATSAHEYGHVEIVRRFYHDARRAAKIAALSVQNDTFYGMGANPEEARKNAMDKARGAVGAQFRTLVSEPCQDASERYDKLTAIYEGNKDFTPELLSQMAFDEITKGKRTTIK